MFHVMAGQKIRQQTANDRRQEPPEEGPNNYDQITFYAFHSFLVEIQTKLETYVPFMSNTNLEIYKAARLKKSCLFHGTSSVYSSVPLSFSLSLAISSSHCVHLQTNTPAENLT